jgi:hypothetical protein
MGLPDNYRLPVAGVLLFGFGYDAKFLQATDGRPWEGLATAGEAIQTEAAKRGISSAGYTRLLQERYRKKMATLRFTGAIEEVSDEQK